MKKLILAAVLAYGPMTFASELDEVKGSSQVTIPATIVIRMDRTTNQMEVLEVGRKIPADKTLASKLATAPFKALSVDGKLAGVASANEADHVSSTSSWGFGFRNPAFGFRRPFYGWNRPYVGFNGFNPYINSLAPSYAYAGVNYAYNPYYSYNYGNYSYAYCQPPVQAVAAQCGACYTPQPAYCGCDGQVGIYGGAYAQPYGQPYAGARYWNWY